MSSLSSSEFLRLFHSPPPPSSSPPQPPAPVVATAAPVQSSSALAIPSIPQASGATHAPHTHSTIFGSHKCIHCDLFMCYHCGQYGPQRGRVQNMQRPAKQRERQEQDQRALSSVRQWRVSLFGSARPRRPTFRREEEIVFPPLR